jgi:hypothetical protein
MMSNNETMRGHSAETAMADEVAGVKSRDPERVTRRDLVEGKIDKVIGGAGAVPLEGGLLDPETLLQLVDVAKVISTAGPVLQPWLQGNVGGVVMMMLRAKELGISFQTLQSWSYAVENKGVATVAYVAQFFIAMINTRAPIKERLRHEYLGEGDERRCRVWATFKGETEARDYTTETLAKLRPAKNEYGKVKGSPLWDTKPDLQLYYNAARDYGRMNFPDVLGGVYSVDEMEDAGFRHVGPDRAKDISPGLRERLRGPVGEGFEHTKSSIEASIQAATPVDRKRSGKAVPAEPAEAVASAEAVPSSETVPGNGAVTHQAEEQAP